MRKLTPRRDTNGLGWVVTFRNPMLEGKVETRSVPGADNEITARTICKDALQLFNDEKLLKSRHPDGLAKYDKRAVRLVLGEEGSELADKGKSENVLERAVDGLARSSFEAGLDTTGSKSSRSEITRMVTHYHNSLKNVTKELAEVRKENKYLREDNTLLRAELDRYRAEANENVKVTIGEAITQFEAWYVSEVKDETFKESVRWVQRFAESLTDKLDTPLRAVTTADVQKWLNEMGKLAAQTRRNRRNPVSKFFNYCQSNFGLFRNPTETIMPIGGGAKNDIVAIESLENIKSLIKALKPLPYWQAWVSLSLLSGPRSSELRNLKIGDVNLADDQITYRKTKTGAVKRNRIEKTLLLPILAKWMQLRLKQKRKPATKAEASDYVFPSLFINHRGNGRWTNSSAWFRGWTKAVTRCGSKTARLAAKEWLMLLKKHRLECKKHGKSSTSLTRWQGPDYWKHTNAVWRHTCGTILGHCGWSAMEIAKFMGNSPTIAERHYVRSASQGAESRWKFRW